MFLPRYREISEKGIYTSSFHNFVQNGEQVYVISLANSNEKVEVIHDPGAAIAWIKR